MLAEPRARLRDGRGLCLADEPRPPVDDHLERPAGVLRRDDGLLGEERLVGHHPEVLVDGRVVDGEAAGVEIGQLVVAHPASEGDAAVEAEPASTLLEPLAIRPLARDDAVERRVLGQRVEHQVDALRAVEAPDGEDEVAVRLAAVRERLRRVRKHLGGDARRALEPAGDVRRRREHLPRLAEALLVEPLHLAAERAVARGLGELPELRAVELVGLAKLVEQPHDLVGMAHAVRRELRRDDEVDAPAVRLRQVGEPPEERLRQHTLARIPLERHRHEIRLVAAGAQLPDELVREDLGAAAVERHLRSADGDSHLRATIA